MADDDKRWEEQWHLDRKVPIAVIVTILIQSGVFVWWASDANSRLGAVEKRLEASAPQADRLTRVEVQLDAVKEGISDIKAMLRRFPLNGASP